MYQNSNLPTGFRGLENDNDIVLEESLIEYNDGVLAFWLTCGQQQATDEIEVFEIENLPKNELELLKIDHQFQVNYIQNYISKRNYSPYWEYTGV